MFETAKRRAQSFGPAVPPLPGSGGGPAGEAELCRHAVAEALGVAPRIVRIGRHDRSPSQFILRSRGQVSETRFFSKMYLVEPYPIESRLFVDWDESRLQREWRSAAKQVDTEWAMTRRMVELTDRDQVPDVLGKSAAAKTIVWNEAKGVRVDRLVRRSIFSSLSSARRLADPVQKAGAWLARVHQATASKRQTLDLFRVEASIKQLLQRRGLKGSRYEAAALRVLDGAMYRVGSTTLEVPVVFAHGDFCLANLVWDEADNGLAVMDFEHAGPAELYKDLLTFLFDLRVKLLNPCISSRLLRTLEDAFWDGYGAVSPSLYAFVSGIASAGIFYYFLPRVLTRGDRRGWWAGSVAYLYRTLFEPSVVTRRLGVPRELWVT